jgi:small subunit ribosomal protein S1
MDSEYRSKHAFRPTPPPMDESWWAAVLSDEERHSLPPGRERGGYGVGDRPAQIGCAEDWMWARTLYETDDTVCLPVIGFNRGGLLVQANSLRGFVPVSHLVEFQPGEDDETRAEHLAAQVGIELCLKVIEYDPERGRLVLSQRAALAGPGRRAELLANLSPGQHVVGTVTNVTRFGVFVDLGGLEGLIHVSELSWGRVRHPSDVVDCGQSMEVQVLSVDKDQARVALSLKELLPDPWETVQERYQVGDLVEGTVTNVVRFGAFVGLEEGLEGLVHVSELGDGSFLHPRSVVREEERVRVRIMSIDAEHRRLALSLRHVGRGGAEVDPSLDEPSGEWEAMSSY